MTLRTGLRTLRATLEGHRARRTYPLLVLPGARCEHDPGCDEQCVDAPAGVGGGFLLYTDGSLRPWEAA
jgi:hypothetical protein